MAEKIDTLEEETRESDAQEESSQEDTQGEEGAKKEPQPLTKEDLDALLKRERELGRQEDAAEIAFKKRKEKRENEGDGDVEEDEKPLSKKEVEDIVVKGNQQTMKQLQAQAIRDKATKLANGDNTLADYIIEIHKNRVFPETLSLDEQLDEASAIATHKSTLLKNDELKRSLKSKETASKDAASSHKDPSASDEPKSSKDIEALKKAGFVWDGKLGVWKKETSGRTITVNPKNFSDRKVIGK